MRTMNKISLAFVAAAALAGCTNSGPAPGGTGPGPITEPSTVGRFESAHGKLLGYPVRVAVGGDGIVYASDAAKNQVIGYKNGNAALAIVDLNQPLGLAVSGDLLYVGNAGREDVEVYSLGQQKYLRSLGGTGAFMMPNSIAVAADGTVYVADSKLDVVRAFSQSGAPGVVIGSTGSGNGQFHFPSGVAVDASRVVVGNQANHRVQIFDRSGSFVRAFGSEVTGGNSVADYRGHFTSIGAVALGPLGIYVVDSAHAYVQVFDDMGAAKGFFGTAGDCSSCTKLPTDISVDGAGHVVAANPEHRRFVTLSTELR